MSSTESVSEWIHKLQEGDRAGVQKLWDRYFHRLVGLARKKLQAMPLRVADEEDVALSGFKSFCRGAEGGRFSNLEDRDNLWALLAVITGRKAYQLRLKAVRDNAVLDEAAIDGAEAQRRKLEEFIGKDLPPDILVLAEEECDRLMAILPDEDLRSVARWKLERHTHEEIARRLGRSTKAVERKLKIIRSFWERQ